MRGHFLYSVTTGLLQINFKNEGFSLKVTEVYTYYNRSFYFADSQPEISGNCAECAYIFMRKIYPTIKLGTETVHGYFNIDTEDNITYRCFKTQKTVNFSFNGVNKLDCIKDLHDNLEGLTLLEAKLIVESFPFDLVAFYSLMPTFKKYSYHQVMNAMKNAHGVKIA